MVSRTKKLITNINTLSALFDRLITERIKAFFFNKNNNSIQKKKYDYLSEQRTFKHNSEKLVKQLEELTFADLNIGIADNKLSNSIKTGQNNNLLKSIKLSRTSLEKRAMLKNEIDKSYKKLLK